MLRSEIKSILILLCFVFLLKDYISPATAIFVLFGSALVYLKVKLHRWLRSILALVVFGSYWFTYGKVIDPEVGLNFLTTVMVLKLLEKESLRDRYMIFFGMILLISAGTLFEKSLTYVLYFAVSFLILIFDFYSELKIKWRLKDLSLALLWVIPLTISLFFFVPRLLSPLPFKQGQKGGDGKIGYTPDLSIINMENLASNTDPVFQALVPGPLPQDRLYWRGNTLHTTDGWNWSSAQGPGENLERQDFDGGAGSIRQSIRLFNRDDFLFSLDHPEVFIYSGRLVRPNGMRTISQRRWNWTPRYDVISVPAKAMTNTESTTHYLNLIISRKDRRWIHDNFKSQTAKELEEEVKRFFYKNDFIYSLSPGRISTFREFMQQKKIGYCSHFASAVAIIFRTKKIPVRLVSGFMGGNYNSFADFYLITQNDAHVWIEALVDNQWVRFDPTAWIAPDRVQLGGEAFMEAIAPNTLALMNLKAFNLKWFMDAKMWLNQWDFRFYTWIEEMDYYGQEALLSRLHFKRQWLIYIVLIVMLVFVGLYAWHFRNNQKKLGINELDELWSLFFKRTKGLGLVLDSNSVKRSEELIEGFKHPVQAKIHELWQELIRLSFEGKESSEITSIRRKIKKL